MYWVEVDMNSVNFRTLDLNLLRVFDEVMTERSLTKAAIKLALTQPAVSNALRRLRETLGDDLLRRSGQGLAPTPRALALWPTVQEALRQLQASLAPSPFVASTATTTFVLTMADATAAELMPGLVEVIGRLPTYTTGSQFIITPVVALVQPGFVPAPSAHEVADVFEVPLPFLMDPAHHRRHAVQWEGQSREWLSMPYQDAHAERFIWGATAGMLRNFYRFLQA